MANLAFNLKPQVIAPSTLITILWVLRTPNAGQNSHFQRLLQSTSVLVQTQKSVFLLIFATNFLLFLAL